MLSVGIPETMCSHGLTLEMDKHNDFQCYRVTFYDLPPNSGNASALVLIWAQQYKLPGKLLGKSL